MFAILKSKYVRCLIGIFVFIFVSFVTYNSYASVCFLPTGDCGGDDVSADTNDDLPFWCEEDDTDPRCKNNSNDSIGCTGSNCNNSDDTETKCTTSCTPETGHRTCTTDSNGCSIVAKECSGNTYLTQAYCTSANSGKTCTQSGSCWVVDNTNDEGNSPIDYCIEASGYYDTQAACTSANSGKTCIQSGGGDCWVVDTSGGNDGGDNSDENDDTGEDTGECLTDEVCFKPTFTCNGQKCTSGEVQQIIDYALEAAKNMNGDDSSSLFYSSLTGSDIIDIIHIDSSEIFNNPPIVKLKKENIEDKYFVVTDLDDYYYNDNPWYLSDDGEQVDYFEFNFSEDDSGNVIATLEDNTIPFSGENNNIIKYNIDFSRCPEDKICIKINISSYNSLLDDYMFNDGATLEIRSTNDDIDEGYEGKDFSGLEGDYIIESDMKIIYNNEKWTMGDNNTITISNNNGASVSGCDKNCSYSIVHNTVYVYPKFVPDEGELRGIFEPFVGVVSCKYASPSFAWYSSNYGYTVGIYNSYSEESLWDILGYGISAQSISLPSFTIEAKGDQNGSTERYLNIDVSSSGYCTSSDIRVGMWRAYNCPDGSLAYNMSPSTIDDDDDNLTALHGSNFTQYDCGGWRFDNQMFESFMSSLSDHGYYTTLEFNGIDNVSWNNDSIQLELYDEWFCYKSSSSTMTTCINLENNHETIRFSKAIYINGTYNYE